MKFTAERIQVTVRAPRRSKRFVFFLEEGVWNQDASNRLFLTGWVVHRRHRVRELRLLSGRKSLGAVAVNEFRPQVSERFSDYPNAQCSGFRLELPSPGTGTYQVQLLTEKGKIIRAGTLELHGQRQPRLIFMHIPKAAGSTLNNWLASHYRPSNYAVHIESQAEWRSNPKQYRELAFVSGHVPVDRLARHFELEHDYLVTVVRSPYAQLASHLAWVRRLSDSGEEHRFQAHPAYAQRLSRKLAEVDFSDPSALADLIGNLDQTETRLLDNCQVRYFSSPRPDAEVTEVHLAKALENARLFNRFGFAERLAEFMESVASDMKWAPPVRVRRQNVSPSYYGLDIENPETREAFRPLVRFDLELYDALLARD